MVSNLGLVKSVDRIVLVNSEKPYHQKKRGVMLTPLLTRKGYYRYILSKDGMAQNRAGHRLVAEAFIPNPENKPQVNHINGVKTNNQLNNLEWCTQKENSRHAYDKGLISFNELSKIKSLEFNKLRIGEKNHKSRKVIDTDTMEIFVSVKEASLKIGVKPATLYARLSGICKNETSLKFYIKNN